MRLTPREKDKLLLSVAAMVARRRLERGVKLNHPEAEALISDFILEGARDPRDPFQRGRLDPELKTLCPIGFQRQCRDQRN